jgi:argininosuccinate lyase
MKKLWGGRFEKETNREVEAFTASIGVDSRLWKADITGSIAHARMLGKVGVLTSSEVDALVKGLESILSDFEKDAVELNPNAEDIHSEIERMLFDKTGTVAGKLHTARSRNDQVATATRLYIRGHVDSLGEEIETLQTWLLNHSEKHLETVLPGLTHMQHAQPVSLAHHWMAYFWMLERDRERLADCRKRINHMPLGSAALAGTSFPLDREMTARELGFDSICENSLDAVSDRDFVVEFLCSASLIMTHLSRMAEELCLWSTPEFGFIELDDSVTTGSSIMPQKKNPDVAELIRGRVGRVHGALMGALTMLKALPLSYNRDLQEDKSFLFDGLDTVHSCVRMTRLMLETVQIKSDKMMNAVHADQSNATDLADALVRKGVTFRDAHEISGKAVRHCLSRGIGLEDLSLDELKTFDGRIDKSVVEALKPLAVLSARKTRGGTGPDAVREQIARARQKLGSV